MSKTCFLGVLHFLRFSATDFDEFSDIFLQKTVINRPIFRPEGRTKDWYALDPPLPPPSRPYNFLDSSLT